ncbi:Magnesium-chelatase subunit ChlH chloroplastic [Bienertia sinuspersici]
MTYDKKLFTISFTTLLYEIAHWYDLPQPLYRQYYRPKCNKYKVVVKMTLKKEATSMKLYSKLHKNMTLATQDVAKQAIKRLQDLYNFSVNDINLDNYMKQRKKRRLTEIKLATEEISFNNLKRSYFKVCDENIQMKQQLNKLQNGEVPQ